jgi:hypothetical protein
MELTRKNCIALRNMAIISFFIHNYCLILPNALAANEFTWVFENIYNFWSSLHNSAFVSFSPSRTLWGGTICFCKRMD